MLTVSDGVAAAKREDTSGAAIAKWIKARNWELVEHRIVPDETTDIAACLTRWADGERVDLVLTTGGTGFGPRDVTPEATASVVERPAPGLAEALRAAGRDSTPFAALSRGVAGIRGRTLIVNLPGSRSAVVEGLSLLEELLPHAVDIVKGKTDHG